MIIESLNLFYHLACFKCYKSIFSGLFYIIRLHAYCADPLPTSDSFPLWLRLL
uniref:LIM zinc-binding domain-containing protein n=1 Tax=Angiostrongylus cantonensis TaxID=6313 RepID=A0A0K0D866_ANGCA